MFVTTLSVREVTMRTQKRKIANYDVTCYKSCWIKTVKYILLYTYVLFSLWTICYAQPDLLEMSTYKPLLMPHIEFGIILVFSHILQLVQKISISHIAECLYTIELPKQSRCRPPQWAHQRWFNVKSHTWVNILSKLVLQTWSRVTKWHWNQVKIRLC